VPRPQPRQLERAQQAELLAESDEISNVRPGQFNPFTEQRDYGSGLSLGLRLHSLLPSDVSRETLVTAYARVITV
jgi:hypothetical protein